MTNVGGPDHLDDEQDAQPAPGGDAAVTVYWRPGCGFCGALLRGLERQELPFARVNIWDEPDAAAFVRSVADGNETVPTVVVGPMALVNPSAREVLAAVAEHAPELLPEGYEPPQPNAFGRAISRLLGG
jgi:mycoredoxin